MAGMVVYHPEGKRYEIVLCGECDLQAERNVRDDWECPAHGRCRTVRFAEAIAVRLVLGKPIGKEQH